MPLILGQISRHDTRHFIRIIHVLLQCEPWAVSALQVKCMEKNSDHHELVKEAQHQYFTEHKAHRGTPTTVAHTETRMPLSGLCTGVVCPRLGFLALGRQVWVALMPPSHLQRAPVSQHPLDRQGSLDSCQHHCCRRLHLMPLHQQHPVSLPQPLGLCLAHALALLAAVMCLSVCSLPPCSAPPPPGVPQLPQQSSHRYPLPLPPALLGCTGSTASGTKAPHSYV